MKRTDSMRQGVGKKAMIPPALFVIGESLLLTFVLEILSRRSYYRREYRTIARQCITE